MRNVTRYYCCVVLCWTTAINASTTSGLARLLHGEVLFESLRDNNFDALQRRNTGLSHHVDNDRSIQDNNHLLPNKLTLVELQLALGLSQLANRNVISQLNNNDYNESNNNDAYLLAQYYYRHERPVDVIRLLNQVQGDNSKKDNADIQYLRALAYIRVGKFSAATELLEHLPAGNDSREYTLYNWGVALLQSGNEEKGISTLSSLGQIETSKPELLALKDKANLSLGYRYLETGKPAQANDHFKRIRLEGPFSNRALLGSGWAILSLGDIEHSIVPWTLLHEKEALNDAAIEAKMALPYAYAKLGAHGKAANLYGHAIELFESELSTLETLINDIRNGVLTKNILGKYDTQDTNWLPKLVYQTWPQQKHHLTQLSADDQFQRLTEDLHHLATIKNRLGQWQTNITSYREFIELKKKKYASILPVAEKELTEIYEQMTNIMAAHHKQSAASSKNANKVTEITNLKNEYSSYLLARKAEAEHNQLLSRLARKLPELSNQLKALNIKLNETLTHTDNKLISVAIDTLEQKRKQLQSYRVNALFALAESYDFATRKQQ